MNNSSNIWFFILVPLGVTFCKLLLYFLGDWLEGSRWTDAITNAKLQTSRSSEAILSANDYGESTELYSHHENTTSFKNMFKKDFESLKYEFEKAGNPFFEDTEILYTLVTKNIMDTSANKSVYEARTLGAEQYSSCKEGVFVLGSKIICETIKRNKFSVYKTTNTLVISKTQKK